MDLVSAGRVRQFIREEARNGNRAVIITSHNMSDIEGVCGRVTILDRGRVLFDGPRRDLNLAGRSVRRIRVRFQGPWEPGSLRHLGTVTLSTENEVHLEVTQDRAVLVTSRLLNEMPVQDIGITDPPLEEILAAIYGRK